MLKRKIVVLLLLMSARAFAQVNDQNDFQWWNRLIVNGPVVPCWGLPQWGLPQWGFHLEAEWRYGDDASTLYLQFYQVNLHYKPLPCLIIGPGYRLLRLQIGEHVTEYSPMLDLIAHASFWDWEFALRSRTQYRIFRPALVSPFWRTRLRFKVTAPWEVPYVKARVRISDEVFWEEGRGVDQNRLQIGLVRQLGPIFKVECAYLLRSLKVDSPWLYHHVFGLLFFVEL